MLLVESYDIFESNGTRRSLTFKRPIPATHPRPRSFVRFSSLAVYSLLRTYKW